MPFSSAEEVFQKMPEAFDPAAAGSLEAVFQFNFSDEGQGPWNVVIKDGACQVAPGTHASPSVTLALSADTWVSMVNKEINGMQAFMAGKLKVSGDMLLAQKIEQLFPL